MIVASNHSSLLMSIAVDRKTSIAGRVVPGGRNVLTAVKDRPVLIR